MIVKKNIFFELYNEPYVDTYSDDYASGFNNYINGFFDGSNYYTGMGQSYLNIRQTNATFNICILGAAENYAYFNLANYYDYTNNQMLNTYNCFTKLQEAVTTGSVSMPSEGKYTYNTFDGIIANLHPYAGFFNTTGGESQKNPGFSNIAGTLQLSDYLLALTTGTRRNNSSVNSFKINIPIICTEYGQYNLPWSDWTTGISVYNSNHSTNPTNYLISGKAYTGQFYDQSLVATAGPALVGMHIDFKTYHVSFTCWACRPNGNWDEYKAYEYWNPNQPDAMIGNCYQSGLNTTGLIRLISCNDFAQPNLSNCYSNYINTSGYSIECPINGIGTNPQMQVDGYQTGGTGADFLYLFNTYYKL